MLSRFGNLHPQEKKRGVTLQTVEKALKRHPLSNPLSSALKGKISLNSVPSPTRLFT